MNPPPIDNEIRPGSIVQPLDNGVPIPVGHRDWFEGRVVGVAMGVARVKIFAGPPTLVGREEPYILKILYKSGAKS